MLGERLAGGVFIGECTGHARKKAARRGNREARDQGLLSSGVMIRREASVSRTDSESRHAVACTQVKASTPWRIAWLRRAVAAAVSPATAARRARKAAWVPCA